MTSPTTERPKSEPTSTTTERPKSDVSSVFPVLNFVMIFSVLIVYVIRKLLRKYKISNQFSKTGNIVRRCNASIQLTEVVTVRENSIQESSTETVNSLLNMIPNSREKDYIIETKRFHDFMIDQRENEHQQLIGEYKKLNKESKIKAEQCGLTTKVGQLHAKKNRYSNILPYDQTRIKLKNELSPLNYINANGIPSIDNAEENEYLAAQGPITESVDDFAKMIWEQTVNCIVMLTRTQENGKFKCIQYWPNQISESIELGDYFKMELIFESENEAFIERKLSLTNKELDTSRSIYSLQMHKWNDHNAPDLKFFDHLLYRFQELKLKEVAPPYLVHCSAGIGRTGTFITLDRITGEIMKGSKEISIYNTIMQLRQYRSMMVQRQIQYVFIHEYLDHFLQSIGDTKSVEICDNDE